MTDEQPPEPGRLTETQHARIDHAHRDLDHARAEDLAQLPREGLNALVDRLCSRLDDILTLTTDPLAGAQRTRVDYARRDVERARAVQAAQRPAEELILLVERLRGRLDDILPLVDEVAAPDSAPPQS